MQLFRHRKWTRDFRVTSILVRLAGLYFVTKKISGSILDTGHSNTQGQSIDPTSNWNIWEIGYVSKDT